ncbi:hypothetical protein [Streptomyces celluloflavus]|uniref:hypothetical protein n=1 Tax=Streptomyces celluloflavus TaxID=58344 RepID=UPI0036BEC4A5
MAFITFFHRPSLRLARREAAAVRAHRVWRRLADAPVTANPVSQALNDRAGRRRPVAPPRSDASRRAGPRPERQRDPAEDQPADRPLPALL